MCTYRSLASYRDHLRHCEGLNDLVRVRISKLSGRVRGVYTVSVIVTAACRELFSTYAMRNAMSWSAYGCFSSLRDDLSDGSRISGYSDLRQLRFRHFLGLGLNLCHI